jgi:hypothetical protein
MPVKNDLKKIAEDKAFSVTLASEATGKSYKGRFFIGYRDSLASEKDGFKAVKGYFLAGEDAGEIPLESFVTVEGERYKLVYKQKDGYGLVKLELYVWKTAEKREGDDGNVWDE